MKRIIDVCCGGKMFWFDKNNENVIFCDKRNESIELCDGRIYDVKPDVQCDFTNLPFDDNSFRLVVFDPPHLENVGSNSWLAKKYGKLDETWPMMIKDGFNECMRVAEEEGIIIFKWNQTDISTNEIIKVIGKEPLFGHKSGKREKTHWLCFMKI